MVGLMLQVLSEMAISGGVVGSPDALIRIYQQLFCMQAYPHTNIVKYNDFSDFSAYLVQKVRYDTCHFKAITVYLQCSYALLLSI